MTINYADIAIVVILVFFAFKGLKNGFLQEFAVLFGVFLGFFLAKQYASDVVPYIALNLSDNLLYCISYGIIVIATLIVASMLARLVSSLLDLAFLGFVDHVLGAVFGALKGIVVVCLIIYVVQIFFNFPLLKSSAFLPYYDKLMDVAETFLTNNPDIIPNTL